MLTFDSVRLRLDREQPLTFLEFNYMILQAYDFLELSRRYDCRLQLGGSDQWGNIINGIELGRRMDGTELFGATTPLITKADGSKMGKSVSGAVWLHEDQLSHWDYWQFWRNADDRDVGKFLRLFTDLPIDEIARLETLEGSAINEAKIILANEATAMCRGKEAAASAQATATQTFTDGTAGADLPTIAIEKPEIGIVEALLEIGFATSRKEAKRLIDGGGARINGEPVTSDAMIIAASDTDVKISAGKKKHGLLTFY
jgi:tyrosyl-tRNA synthetase